MKTIALSILLLIAFQCSGQEPELSIAIDERIETLYTVAYLNDYFLVSEHENLHKRKIREELQALKTHEAVQLFDSLSKNYHFSYYRTVEWILQLSSFPEFRKIKEKADNYATVPEDKEFLLEKFRVELIRFNQDPLFQSYLESVKPLSQKVLLQIQESGTIGNLPAYLENYFGKKLSSYNLILSPLLHAGGFNSELINQNGETEVYALVGPNGEIDFMPYFDKGFLETDLVLHEFGHSFVNPLLEKYDKEIDHLKAKYFTSQLKESAKHQGYREWKFVFNELLLRAITIQLAERYYGKERAEELLEYESSIGFELVGDILDVLKEYEENRNKYPDFDKFYPVLIDHLK